MKTDEARSTTTVTTVNDPELGKMWRRRRDQRDYGSWFFYRDGRIVNLHTEIIDEAKAKARKLMGAEPANPSRTSPVPNNADSAPVLPFSRPEPPRFSWAGPGPNSPAGGVVHSPHTTPPVSAPPQLSPAMEGLAEGIATAMARFNAACAVLAVKTLGNVKAKPDPSEIDALEKTYTLGAKELLAKTGLQWWHMLIIQNGTMVANMLATGEKLPPKLTAPVEPAPAAA